MSGIFIIRVTYCVKHKQQTNTLKNPTRQNLIGFFLLIKIINKHNYEKRFCSLKNLVYIYTKLKTTNKFIDILKILYTSIV